MTQRMRTSAGRPFRETGAGALFRGVGAAVTVAVAAARLRGAAAAARCAGGPPVRDDARWCGGGEVFRETGSGKRVPQKTTCPTVVPLFQMVCGTSKTPAHRG